MDRTKLQRHPPPQLFQGPGSSGPSTLPHDSSSKDLSSIDHDVRRAERSSLEPEVTKPRSRVAPRLPTWTSTTPATPAAPAGHLRDSGADQRNGGRSIGTPPASKRSPTDAKCVEALWAKMQLTLEEVELSAQGATHVFGAAHNAALEELTNAQIRLAKSWIQAESDENAGIAPDPSTSASSRKPHSSDGPAQASKNSSRSSTISHNAQTPHDFAAKGSGSDTHKEFSHQDHPPADATDFTTTEEDFAEAETRRAENDRIFQKVHHDVQDLVSKLDGVAAAMTKVERESREMWEDSDEEDSDPTRTPSASQSESVDDSGSRSKNIPSSTE